MMSRSEMENAYVERVRGFDQQVVQELQDYARQMSDADLQTAVEELMKDPDAQIAAFEATQFESVDDITAALRPMMGGYYGIGALTLPPLKIYRGRRSKELPLWDKVSDLSYPKNGARSDQRASRKGVEIFYGASNYNLAVAEIRTRWGDYIVLSEWEITSPIMLQVVGMDDIPEEYKSENKRDIKLTEFLKRRFYDVNGRLWSIAVSEFYLGEIDYGRMPPDQLPPVTPDAFHGLKYPSAVQPTLGHNFAIRSSFVDSKMKILRADLLHFDPARTEGLGLRHADQFDGETILWQDV